MKKYPYTIAASIIAALFIGWFVKTGIDNTRETQYCGKVVKCYMTAAAYKVTPSRHVVFYNDSLKRNIDVRVTNNQFVNTKEGQIICFDLNKMQLEE